ncbi:glycosyltransferase family 61 protein [Coleofasciculus sp. H7-2]|uniref:glycosyltransferase family 61 protein n=1 Tax=Coleofasciculus sp. H7-2 TaxID=3351545 RepID=UPI00366B1FC8
MNKIWSSLQQLLITKLIYPILLKYIDTHLLTTTEVMEQSKRENNIPNLEEEYKQIPALKFIYFILFNYINKNLISRVGLTVTSKNQHKLYQLNYEKNIKIQLPITDQEIPNILKEKAGIFKFTVPFAAEIKNVELFGVDAIGFTEDKKIILETALDRVDCLQHSVISTLKQGFNFQYIRPMPNSENIDLACSLVNYWSRLYAHWISEGLTRLEALEYYSKKTGKKPVLIIDKDPPIWKIKSLELMGYRPEDCIQWNGYRAKVNELVICSKRREEGRVSIKAYYWLRERILGNIDSYAVSKVPLSPNIFISRRKTNARCILNEEEVINTLAEMDFITYVFEDIDWQNQVKIFAQAKIIVAPHGAGLTNMIFSQRATIIEIFGDKISHFFYTMAQGLKFNYGCLFCEANNENMIVNCEQLSKLIYKMSNKTLFK